MRLHHRTRILVLSASLTAIGGMTGACSSSSSSSAETPIPDSADSQFQLDSDAFQFTNFADGYPDSQMTNDGMVRLYGAKVCASNDAPCSTLTPAASTWMGRVNASMAGGRCEGFAVLSSLFFVQALDPNSFGATRVRDLTLDGNTALQEEIAYWFATQTIPVTTENTKKFGANDALRFLSTYLKPGGNNGEFYRIGLAIKNGHAAVHGAHAVTPLSYAKLDASTYLIHVYDNNFPSEDRYITVYADKDRWEYKGSSDTTSAGALYYGDSTNNNPLYFAPVHDRLGTQTCSFCAGSGSGSQVQVQSADVTVSNASGTTTVTNGDIEEGTGASVSPSFSYTGQADTWDNETPIVISLPAGDNTVKISGHADGSSAGVPVTISQFGPGFSVNASNLTLDTMHTDTMTVSADGSKVGYANTSGTPISLNSAVTTASGAQVQVEIDAPAGATNVSTAVDPTSGAITAMAANTANQMVTLTVTVANPTTGTTQTASVTTQGGSNLTLTAPTTMLMQGGMLVVTQNNGDGTPPSTVADQCTDGMLDGTETGVDCGGTCPTKCAVSQGCNANTDCANGKCDTTTHVCVSDFCTDGTQDGTETDVDCGGSCATKCAVAKTCAVNGDCASSACDQVTHACVADFCTDGTKDGTETDVDCGGSCATKCATGQACAMNGDCTTNDCNANVCTVDQCTDGVKDGTEGDVDCGGTCPNKCPQGDTCNTPSDCTINLCTANVCDTPDRIVFVSSATYDGNLGGIAGGDADCQALATAAGLYGTFKAFLADSTHNAETRMTVAPGQYVRPDGVVIAANAAAFFSNTHAATISVDETMSTVANANVWTGSDALGNGPPTNNDCSDWSTNLAATIGMRGDTNATNNKWANDTQIACSNTYHLYCVRQ